MRPILFTIGSLPIYGYGFMLALAFLVGIYLASREAKRKGLDGGKIIDFCLYAILAGVLGSRLFYVALNFEFYRDDPLRILMIQEGGLAMQGGIIAGIVVGIWFALHHRLGVGKLADTLAPSLAIGTAIARWGCFLNGCCYGQPSSLPWAVNFFDVPRHPTQIYESLLDLVMFLIIWKLRKHPRFDGYLFLIYVILYAIIRFTVEFLRVSPFILPHITVFQLVSLLMFSGAIVVYVVANRKQRNLPNHDMEVK